MAQKSKKKLTKKPVAKKTAVKKTATAKKPVVKTTTKKAQKQESSPFVLVLVGVAALGVVGFGYLGMQDIDTKGVEEPLKTQQEQNQKQADDVSISKDGKTVSYNGVDGEVALVTLKAVTSVKTKNSGDLGEFVTEINGVEAEDGQNFWAFYVDGKQADKGASNYETKFGEKVEWRLEDIKQLDCNFNYFKTTVQDFFWTVVTYPEMIFF